MSTDSTGLLFIISAPSGAGKTSLVNALCQSSKDIEISISHTTRQKREGEENGVDYHFIDDENFNRMISENRFLEYARVFDHQYGTSRDWVEKRLQSGQNIILEIDWQGAEQVMKLFPESVSIFILPPSFETLKTRLVGRGNDSEEIIKGRMDGALDEIRHFDNYQQIIINDDFQNALDELDAIIHHHDNDSRRQPAQYQDFVEKLVAEGEKA